MANDDVIRRHVGSLHGEAAWHALAGWQSSSSSSSSSSSPLSLVRRGPLAWIAVGPGASLSALCFVDGAWRLLEREAAFAQVIVEARPPLLPWEPLVRAWENFTLDEILATDGDVNDASDPGFNLFPLSRAARDAWEPPSVVDGVLRFVAVRHGTARVVRVDGTSYAVETSTIDA